MFNSNSLKSLIKDTQMPTAGLKFNVQWQVFKSHRPWDGLAGLFTICPEQVLVIPTKSCFTVSLQGSMYGASSVSTVSSKCARFQCHQDNLTLWMIPRRSPFGAASLVLNGPCNASKKSHLLSLLYTTSHQVFPWPPLSSIPFAPEWIWFDSHSVSNPFLKVGTAVSHEYQYWRKNELAFFAHLSVCFSHGLCSGSLTPADCQLWEEESSSSCSWVSELDCSQCLLMEYCAQQETPGSLVTAAVFRRKRLAELTAASTFPCLTIVGGCWCVFDVPAGPCEFLKFCCNELRTIVAYKLAGTSCYALQNEPLVSWSQRLLLCCLVCPAPNSIK